MASREEIFTAKILINDQEAENKLKKMEQQLAVLKKRRDEALRDGKIDVWKAANKEIERLSKNIDKQKTLVQGLNHTLDDMSTAKQKELEQVVKAVNRQLNSGAVKRNSKEWSDLNEVLKQARSELKRIREEGQEQPSVWGRFFKFLNDSWGGVLIIFQSITGISQTIRGAVQDYAAMEEEMAGVRKYTGMTASQVEDLNEEFKKMDTRTSREQLNQLAGSAGRLGLQARKDILDFVEAADMIGVALGDDLGDGAVDKIGKLAMAFGEDDSMGLREAMLATGSALNELAQNSSAQAGYLVEFTARVAGFGKQLGLTQAQIMGFGTVMDENLLKDEMAATAFGNMLTKMQTDTEKFARIAGMEVKAFADLLGRDANAAILRLADSLRKADPQTMMKMLDDMGLDGSRAVGVLSTLADKIDDVRKHQQRAADAYREGTSVISEYDTMNNTVEAGLDKVKKQFREMTVELGERLLPVVKYTISGAGMLARGLNTITGFAARNWKAIATLTSGIVAYYVAVNIATVKEKYHAAALALSNARHKAAAALKAADAAATVTLHTAIDLLTGRITLATAAQRIFNGVVKANPYVATAAMVMALVGTVLSFIDATGKATKAQKALDEAAREAQAGIRGEKGELDALVSTARDKALADDTRREAIRKLQEKYPDFLKSLTLEKINTQEATAAIDNLTASLMAEAKARTLVRKIQEAEEERLKLDEEYFKGISGMWHWMQADFQASMNDIADKAERTWNTVAHFMTHGDLKGWEDDTYITRTGRSVSTMEQNYLNYRNAVNESDEAIRAMNEDLKEQVRIQSELKGGNGQGTAGTPAGQEPPAAYQSDAEEKKRLKERRRQEAEEKRRLKERADAARAQYQEEVACEMMAYRQGLSTYTDYMEERHGITQKYYEAMKRIYGEDSTEYRKLLDNRENEEMQYYQWKARRDEQTLGVDKMLRDQEIRRRFMQQEVTDTEAMNEALFQSDIAYMRQRQNLYKAGSKEWEEQEMQIRAREKEHQFQQEQAWMEKLGRYREQMGKANYDRLQEIELKGVETFYGALVASGQMTREEVDAIIEHIKRKYAELKAQQAADNDLQGKAAKGLDTARKNAGAKSTGAGGDAATGIFSITQAVSQQQAVNEELKRLYGEDYENNREYQEAKRQLDADTMQQVVAGAQAAYQTISQFMSAASSYAQACSDLETAKITADYDRQIEAAGRNTKRRERLEKQKEKAIAKAKTEANKKAMVMEMAQAVAQAAMGAISAYSSTMAGAPYPANLVLAPLSAGIALAAGAVQIAAIRKQHEAQEAGYYEGDFTGGRRYRKEAGVVHEGEFVANHNAVNNPHILPVLSLIDQAQRANRVGTLRAEDVTNVMGGPAASVVVPTVNVQAPDSKELYDTLEMVRDTQERLATQLEQGIGVDVPIEGENGIYRKLKRYENLLKNK